MFNHPALFAVVRIVGSQIRGHRHIQNTPSEEAIVCEPEQHVSGHQEGEMRSHNCPLTV